MPRSPALWTEQEVAARHGERVAGSGGPEGPLPNQGILSRPGPRRLAQSRRSAQVVSLIGARAPAWALMPHVTFPRFVYHPSSYTTADSRACCGMRSAAEHAAAGRIASGAGGRWPQRRCGRFVCSAGANAQSAPSLPAASRRSRVQQLVAEPAFEALNVPVLPRAARLDEQSPHADSAQPLTDEPGGELRTVLRSDVSRNAARGEQP